jgi:mRNA interferase HigB
MPLTVRWFWRMLTATSANPCFPRCLCSFWERASVPDVRVFNRSTVRAFADAHADARQPLFAWFAEVERANRTADDIEAFYASASFVAQNRVVFNVNGNKYRVVVAVKYECFVVYIRFIGTHAEYDKIDAATV